MENIKRIAVTGAAGNIAYSLLFRLANGDLFGKEQKIALQLLEVPEAEKALTGVKMELEDCAFPLLQEIKFGTDPNQVFADSDAVFLVGAKPRGPGMERKDLLSENSKIFVEQGKALNKVAKRDAKVLVVGNPCNTNCLIAMHHAPNIPKKNFFAMTRLDQNRAQSLLAQKAGVSIEKVTHMTIWGNHSSTQVPDFKHVKIDNSPCETIIKDQNWLEGAFIEKVQKRGAEIIAARGKSSAASAANAAIDAMRGLFFATPKSQWYSMGVSAQGNPYGIDEDLIFSFPIKTQAPGVWEFVPNLEWDAFLEKKIRASEKELIEEREMVLNYVS